MLKWRVLSGRGSGLFALSLGGAGRDSRFAVFLGLKTATFGWHVNSFDYVLCMYSL